MRNNFLGDFSKLDERDTDMKIIPNRVKNAVKCLMGRNLSVAVPTTHNYKINYNDEKRFVGETVIVTGGTGAIGSAICYQLAACGALVGMCGRSKEKIEATIENIRKESSSVANNIVPVVLDVNNDKQIENAISDFVAQYGKLNVFVNNAGG